MSEKSSFKQLKEVAKELNDALLLSPPIDYIKTTMEQLEKEVKKAAEIIRPGDEIKESTLQFLFDIHALIGKSSTDFIVIDKKKRERKIKPKVRDLYDCFGKDYDRRSIVCRDCERRYICRRKYAQTLAILRSIKEGKIVRKEENILPYRYTRYHALVDALKIGGTRKEIISMSNELYMQKGGKDGISLATNIFKIGVPILLLVKKLRKHGDFYLLRKI